MGQEELPSIATAEMTKYCQDLGMEVGPPKAKRRSTKKSAKLPAPSTTGELAVPALPAYKSLDEIRCALGEGCGTALCATKNKLVFGVGDPKARLMFVGEGPGADEDAQGLPFVGRAGQLLTKIIEAMGLKREDVYIANIVKCRPPQNRVPLPEEITRCSPFLRAQIAVVRPQVIVSLGATSATTLLGVQSPMGPLRGKFHPLVWDPTVPVLPTYHPAYLLRNPPAKKYVWDDMKIVMARLAETN